MKENTYFVPPPKDNKNKKLGKKKRVFVPPPKEKQIAFDFGVQVERKVDGIEMGVLDNGMTYLTQSGLAKMAGIDRQSIRQLNKEWEASFHGPMPKRGRMAVIKQYLLDNGYHEPKLYLALTQDNSIHHAYPDIVCTAIIDFFAFEAQERNEIAQKYYRNLSRYGLQQFIYTALKYKPEDEWRYFLDRVSILKDQAPSGYFIVFREVSDLIVDLIHAGLTVNDKTIPDVSVGSCWGQYWTDHGLDGRFGERIKYEHSYPDYYPQAESNPQFPWAYPDEALPAFRSWFREEYLTTKFPPYMLRKATVLIGGDKEARKIANLYKKSDSVNRIK